MNALKREAVMQAAGVLWPGLQVAKTFLLELHALRNVEHSTTTLCNPVNIGADTSRSSSYKYPARIQPPCSFNCVACQHTISIESDACFESSSGT